MYAALILKSLFQHLLTLISVVWPKQKESDQQITVRLDGSLTTYTQKGLAAGQEYTVSITGEIDGRRGGPSSAEFTTRELTIFICLFAFNNYHRNI